MYIRWDDINWLSKHILRIDSAWTHARKWSYLMSKIVENEDAEIMEKTTGERKKTVYTNTLNGRRLSWLFRELCIVEIFTQQKEKYSF